MSDREIKIHLQRSEQEKELRKQFFELYRNCPIPDDEQLMNLGLFLKRQDLSRFLFMNHLYEQIISVHGVVIEFGVRWGQNLALFQSLRGIHEPFNHNRKVVGFDTFEGFPSVDEKDGPSEITNVGAYATTANYEDFLEQILTYHEQESPIPHIKKFELVKGDAGEEIVKYLKKHPETIVAMAYFDMDLYEPTLKCLEAIKPHLTKGSLIGFDELNVRAFPGETVAVKEVLGASSIRIQRTPYSAAASYAVIE